jgi:hypothetical protein
VSCDKVALSSRLLAPEPKHPVPGDVDVTQAHIRVRGKTIRQSVVYSLTGLAIGLAVDLDGDNRADVLPLPLFRLRLSNDPPSLVPSAVVAQVFELLISTATLDLDLLGRSVRERQRQDVRHVARNAA